MSDIGERVRLWDIPDGDDDDMLPAELFLSEQERIDRERAMLHNITDSDGLLPDRLFFSDSEIASQIREIQGTQRPELDGVEAGFEDMLSAVWDDVREDTQNTISNAMVQSTNNAETYKRANQLISNVGSNGLKISSVIGVVNPALGELAEKIESIGKFAVDTYNKLNELADSLNNLNASMQILGLNTEELQGASELANDLNEINVIWKDFIFNVKKDLTGLYNGIDNGEELRNAIAVGAGVLTGGAGLVGMSAGGWLSNKLLKAVGIDTNVNYGNTEEEDNKKLSEIVEKQIVNINGQNKVSEESLTKVASSLGAGFIGRGLLTGDADIYTSSYLGIGNKIGNNLNLTDAEMLDLYKKLGSFSTSFKNNGLSNYGLGISEESVYGYTYANYGKDFGMLSVSEQIKMAEETLQKYISSSEEGRIAMDRLGTEVKNNTSAIQSWQYLETIGGKSTEYVGAGVNSFLAVDKNNKEITDAVFGNEEDRAELIRQNSELITKAENIYGVLVNQSNNGVKSIDEWVKYNSALKGIDANIVNAPSITEHKGGGMSIDEIVNKYKNGKTVNEIIGNNLSLQGVNINIPNAPSTVGSGMSLDEVIAQNQKNNTMDINVITSPLFDVQITSKITEAVYNVTKNAFNKVFN